MRPTAVTIVAAALLWGGVVAAQDQGVRTVASVREIMLEMVVPSSDAVFNVAIEAPGDDASWATLAAQTRVLAESGNLLMLGDRDRGDEAWTAMARAQVDAAVVTLEAIDARDVDAVIAAGDVVYEACATCHDRFM